MRRSRLDIRLGRFITVGQTYRDRDTGRVWRVRQVHRADCQVELDDELGQRTCIPFAQLRAGWVWIANTPTKESHA